MGSLPPGYALTLNGPTIVSAIAVGFVLGIVQRIMFARAGTDSWNSGVMVSWRVSISLLGFQGAVQIGQSFVFHGQQAAFFVDAHIGASILSLLFAIALGLGVGIVNRVAGVPPRIARE